MSSDRCREKIIKEIGPDATICSQAVCEEAGQEPEIQRLCREQWEPLTPFQSLECINRVTGEVKVFPFNELIQKCQELHSYDPNWELKNCYCCCPGISGAKVSTTAGERPIENIDIGDDIETASVKSKGEKLQLKWSTKKAAFSSGTTGDNQELTLIYLRFDRDSSMIVTFDQLFLQPSGKLIRADRLVPERDMLVKADGSTVVVNEMRVGRFEVNSIHHIAAGIDFNGEIDGHILNLNGIACGDYLLQLHQSELIGLMVDGHDQLPVIGSADYCERYPHLKSKNPANEVVALTGCK